MLTVISVFRRCTSPEYASCARRTCRAKLVQAVNSTGCIQRRPGAPGQRCLQRYVDDIQARCALTPRPRPCAWAAIPPWPPTYDFDTSAGSKPPTGSNQRSAAGDFHADKSCTKETLAATGTWKKSASNSLSQSRVWSGKATRLRRRAVHALGGAVWAACRDHQSRLRFLLGRGPRLTAAAPLGAVRARHARPASLRSHPAFRGRPQSSTRSTWPRRGSP